MTHSHQYELMVILDTEIDERLVPATLDRLLKVITTDGGTIDTVDVWGRRRFAYEIQKKTEGVYAVVNFTSSSATAQELDRQLKLNEQVVRTKVLRAEDAIAMVAAEKERSDARAARKGSAPSGDAPARTSAPRAPRAPRPDRDRSDRPARSSAKA